MLKNHILQKLIKTAFSAKNIKWKCCWGSLLCFFTCPNHTKIFSVTPNYFFGEYNFSRDPMSTLKGSFTNEIGALNDLMILSVLVIFTLFVSYWIRKKICSEMVCRIGAAHLLKKTLLHVKGYDSFLKEKLLWEKWETS